MKAGITLIQVVVAVALCGALYFMYQKFSGPKGAPTVAEITPIVRNFIENKKSSYCSGPFEIKQLTEVTVGEYVSTFKGYPIYANHSESCPSQGKYGGTFTYNSLDSVAKKKALGIAQKSGGTWVIVNPAMNF